MSMPVPQAVAPVFITEELTRRAAHRPDYLQQTLALQELAREMVDNPDHVLPRLVDIAIDMCDSVSGGISLFEPDPPPGVFRWQHLRGDLEKFTGATTPRNFSPCGITLDNRAPILVQRPERVYTWLQDAKVSLPECLLVPLYLGGNEPLGTLWIVSEEEGHFDSGHSDVMLDLAAFTGIALKMAQNERRLKEALEQQETVTREMGHRVKNVFAIIDAMIRMGARGAGTVKELGDGLSGRVHALATAHGLVRRTFDSKGLPREASDFADVIGTILRPYERSGNKVSGPPVRIGSNATNNVALLFHELATNAAKYGALSEDGGSVRIAWQVADDRLCIAWVERGGPPIAAMPERKGFGTLLSEKTIAAALGGTIAYDWQAAGLSVVLSVPLDRLTR